MRGSVVKKGSRWYISVYTGMVEGKRTYKWYSGYESMAEAEKALPVIMLEVQKGIIIDTTNMKASQFFEQWIDDYVTPNTAPATADKYRSAVKAANVVFGNEKIQKVTGQHIQRYINHLTKERKSRQTIVSYYNAIKSALNKAAKWKVIAHNPCVDITLPKEKKKTMKTLSQEEVAALLKTAEGTPMHIIIMLAAGCGMRRGEILGLTWRNIDFARRVIHVSEAYTQSSEGVKMGELKTEASHRSIDFNDTIKTILERQKDKQERFIREQEGNVIRIDNNPIDKMKDLQVCTWEDNLPIRPDYVTKKFQKLVKEAHVQKVRFHDLRHTHATLLMKAGVPAKVVQERLGHTDIKITLGLYSHVLPSMQREAAEILTF